MSDQPSPDKPRVIDYAPPEPAYGRNWLIIAGACLGLVFTMVLSFPLGYTLPVGNAPPSPFVLRLGLGFVVLGLISIMGVVASMRRRQWILAGLCIGVAATLLIEGACFTINAR